MIQSTVSSPPILPKKIGGGRKRKAATHSKDIHPSNKLGKYQDHNLALSKIRALPGLSITQVSASQSEEAETVEGPGDCVWGLGWGSSSDLSDFFGTATVSSVGNMLCDITGKFLIENQK